ncbi:CLC_0170 family protein [Alicyclobacillus herbarius]|uniref:CLC_0170 family protein n=2 Tax=Alicyclobacillus herbarius TaxID=122960 RepID=UPI0003F9549E
MIRFDWTQGYPLMGGVMFVLCGLFLIFFETWRYKQIEHMYEARLSWICGWVQMVIGVGLIVGYILYWYVL